MSMVLRGGRVIDPGASSGPVDAPLDVVIDGGAIVEVGRNLAGPAGARVVDVRDRLVCPGFIDLHAHLREPGHEYKEDIASGTRAAAAGGFTTVCAMPNTSPPNDCRSVTELIVSRAREVGHVRVLPIGAISRGQKGEALAEFGDMKEAGIVAVSDDGRPVMDAGLMRRALEYARTFGLPVVQHAEDLSLVADGIADEGPISTRFGLPPRPAAAESAMVARDLELCALTDSRYHVAHASAARTVELVRDAKRRGLPVTCEAAPHHFSLTAEALCGYNTNAVVAPPLRSGADVDAIIAGLADGTIDCIATDHAPHSPIEKEVELCCAAPGMIGFETALPTALDLWRKGALSLTRIIELFTAGPARVFGLESGTLDPGRPADVCVIDPDRAWVVEAATLYSRSKNTPLLGKEVQGRCVLTLYGGVAVHDPEELAS